MSLDYQCGVLRDVAGGLLSTTLHYESTEATQIYILLLRSETLADALHECLY